MPKNPEKEPKIEPEINKEEKRVEKEGLIDGLTPEEYKEWEDLLKELSPDPEKEEKLRQKMRRFMELDIKRKPEYPKGLEKEEELGRARGEAEKAYEEGGGKL